MKQLACEALGNKCNVVLTAPTEERLVEVASIHVREAHGMASIPQEKAERIKQLMTNKTARDAASVADRIIEKYNCEGDPDCTWRYISEVEMVLTNSGTIAHERELEAA